MDFNLIRKDVRSLKFDALRTDCDNFFEGVIMKEEIAKLNTQLKNFFGEPIYPSNARLSFKAEQTVNGFGGLMPGQTLYYKSDEDKSVFAMLWPWKDGVRTTVKIVQQ